jgi:glycerol-3-phosphate cytidylyltransferase
MKTVLTFGTFDIFHAGHEHYLREAKKHGDKLITVIGRDQTVYNLKGKAPKHNEDIRKKTVEESGIPDKVVLGDLENYYACIIEQQADIICLGYDQRHLADGLEQFLKAHQLKIKIIRLDPFQPEKYKSSKLQ